MKNLIFIALIFFFATSCKKETTVVIQAQDYITGDGSAYAGQEYAVVETWTPFQETKSEIVSEGFLDADGKASFNLKMKNNRRYILGVSEPDDVCYGGLNQYYLDHIESNLVNFDYLTCGYLNINHINVNCEDANDEFRFKYYYSADTSIYIYWAFWGDDVTNLMGCQNAVFPVFNERPVGNYTVEWEAIRTSGTTTGTDSFTINENDTTTYVIEY
jgi:hypothetical protein